VIIRNKVPYSWNVPIIATLLFVFISLPGLKAPLHGDESTTYLEHVSSSLSQVIFHYTGPNQHTLFTILSNASMRFFGEYEFTFRLPVLLAAIVSIFLIYYLGQTLWNYSTAIIASLLTIGSYHHYYWAQHGRGYALTEILALSSVLGVILLLEENSNKKGAFILIFSGLALCLTQPSNAYFLPGCCIAVIYASLKLKNFQPLISWIYLRSILLPLLFLMTLIAVYFFIIYDDLLIGIESYKVFLEQHKNSGSISGSFQQFYEVISDLSRPWGLWIYLPVLYGIWTINDIQRGLFLIILGTPFLLVILSGMMGPPRVYIYVLPFLILLAAVGIEKIVALLPRSIPSYFKSVLVAIIYLALFIPSISSHAQTYLGTRGIEYATMKESREVFSYLKNHTSKYELLVIPIDDMALRRALEPLVAKQMLGIFKDGTLDRITFIGHRNVPLTRIASVAKIPPSAIPDSLIGVIKNIGAVNVSRMKVNVTSLFPVEIDTNFEQEWGKSKNPKISQKESYVHRILGTQSLQINKSMEEDVLLKSPFIDQISSKGRSFILYGYGEKFKQKSKAGFLSKGNQIAFSLNHLFGVYREEKNALVRQWIHPFFTFRDTQNKELFKWQIIFMLLPLNAGLQDIQRSLFIKDETSYFDGFQGYILTPKT